MMQQFRFCGCNDLFLDIQNNVYQGIELYFLFSSKHKIMVNITQE